eukprot:403433-Rhodomonas_salina.1
MVEKQEEDAVKARSELMEREETVRELALKVEHALEQADRFVACAHLALCASTGTLHLVVLQHLTWVGGGQRAEGV